MLIDDEVENIRSKLSEMDKSIVKVALFGQPGAGKSSLINKMVGKKVAEVDVRTDTTVDLAWHEANGLKFGDLPGYGTIRFPKESYFQQFDIEQFDLFLCVSDGKFHQADTEFFSELKKRGKVCIFIFNRCENLYQEDLTDEELKQRKRDDITKQVGQKVHVIFTSCRENIGLDELNEAIRNNLKPAKRERWERSAKAYSMQFLQEKRKACEEYVAVAAGAAAANGLNPIPGANVAVDISIIVGLFASIRDNYGLNDSELGGLVESTAPSVAQGANYVLRFATKEGVAMILKNYAVAETAKTILEWIPLVGQAIAAGIGYLIVSNAGKDYHDKCYSLAEQILKDNISG